MDSTSVSDPEPVVTPAGAVGGGGGGTLANVHVVWSQVYQVPLPLSWPYTMPFAYSMAPVPPPPAIALPFSNALPAASSVYTLPLASVNEPDPGVMYDMPVPRIGGFSITTPPPPNDVDPSWSW